MIAAFSELHYNIQKSGTVSPSVHSLNILLQKSCIVLLLHLAHPNFQNSLLFGRQPLLNITLKPPEEEGPEDLKPPKSTLIDGASRHIPLQFRDECNINEATTLQELLLLWTLYGGNIDETSKQLVDVAFQHHVATPCGNTKLHRIGAASLKGLAD